MIIPVDSELFGPIRFVHFFGQLTQSCQLFAVMTAGTAPFAVKVLVISQKKFFVKKRGQLCSLVS